MWALSIYILLSDTHKFYLWSEYVPYWLVTDGSLVFPIVYLWKYSNLSVKGDIGLDRNLSFDFKHLSQESVLCLLKCQTLGTMVSLHKGWVGTSQVTPGNHLFWEVEINVAYSAFFLGYDYNIASKTQWHSIYTFCLYILNWSLN